MNTQSPGHAIEGTLNSLEGSAFANTNEVNSRNVMVTGASSGIGAAIARLLRRAGFRVFAGTRKAEDGERLRSESNSGIVPVVLDVTAPDTIRSAAEEVQRIGGGRLAGLVNNAGVFFMLPIELTPVEAAREMIEVNLLGTMAVTQQFLPLLRAGRGRVVIIGSGAGRAAAPGSAMYSASKHGQEALAASMRMEFAQFGVGVTLVAPGAVKTPIWEKSRAVLAHAVSALGSERTRPYEGLLERIDRMEKTCGQSGVDPSEVAGVVLRALHARRMRPRYSIGFEAHVIDLLRFFPARAREFVLRKQFAL